MFTAARVFMVARVFTVAHVVAAEAVTAVMAVPRDPPSSNRDGRAEVERVHGIAGTFGPEGGAHGWSPAPSPPRPRASARPRP
ncbi:hypothetical protein, partial [Streptomyces sp. NPDC004726]